MNSSFDHYPLRSEHKPFILESGKNPASELPNLPGQVMASFQGFFKYWQLVRLAEKNAIPSTL